VQRLIESGELIAVGTDRIDRGSVIYLKAARAGRHRRTWTASTAWAAVAILSGLEVHWVAQPQLSRVRAALRATTAEDLVARTGNRARVRRYRVNPAAVERIRPHIVASGTNMFADLTDSSVLDGYVSAQELRRLYDAYRLRVDWDGRITLRDTSFDIEVVRQIAEANDVLAALDLAGSLNSRERTAGMNRINDALEVLRG
jgi:hypothetical protein